MVVLAVGVVCERDELAWLLVASLQRAHPLVVAPVAGRHGLRHAVVAELSPDALPVVMMPPTLVAEAQRLLFHVGSRVLKVTWPAVDLEQLVVRGLLYLAPRRQHLALPVGLSGLTRRGLDRRLAGLLLCPVAFLPQGLFAELIPLFDPLTSHGLGWGSTSLLPAVLALAGGLAGEPANAVGAALGGLLSAGLYH